MARLALALVATLGLLAPALGFYLPGVAPQDFKKVWPKDIIKKTSVASRKAPWPQQHDQPPFAVARCLLARRKTCCS